MTDLGLMDLRLIFHSIHNVMLAEELLLEADVPIEMIPVPREISSDCGMCLACRLKDLERIRESFKKKPFTSSITIYESNKPDPDFKLLLTLS